VAAVSARIRHRKFTGRQPVKSPICAGRSGDAVTMGGAREARSGRQNAPIQSRPCDRIREADRRLRPFVSDVDRVRP
jgi:hypothetical protein